MSDAPVTEPAPEVVPQAKVLRAMGIDTDQVTSDTELEELVALLLDVGLALPEMADEALSELAGPRMIRPDAHIEPETVFNDIDREFRARAAIALGFMVVDETRLLTPAEVDAIQFFNRLRDLIGEEDLLATLRVMGNSMSRLARSVISALRLHFETPILEETGSLVDVANAYRSMTEQMMDPFLDASSTVLRRHMALVVGTPTVWNVDHTYAATVEQATVGFMDLVGFTAFTERVGLKDFVATLTAFESQAQEIIVTNGGTLVKLIGDEAMFVAPTPAAGVEIARRLLRVSPVEEGSGGVRIGLSCGEVVAIRGDYYGTVVNVASRAADEADPGKIVVTSAVANGAHASAAFESIGERSLRGLAEPVELFELK